MALGLVTWSLALLVVSVQSSSSPDVIHNSSCQSSVYNTRFPNVTWDNERWQLATTNLEQGRFQTRMTLANGYHGISVAALGPFFEADIPVNGDNTNGWPLFSRRQTQAIVGGFWDSQPRTNGSNFPWLYQYGWDTAISGIPHWGGIIVDLGDVGVLNASTDKTTISNFNSMLDMRKGVLNWAFSWSPQGTENPAFDITYQMFLHKVQVNQGFVSMTITPQANVNLTVVNVLDGDSSVRTNTTSKGVEGDLIYSAVSPWGVPDVKAYVYSTMTVNGAHVRSTHNPWNAPYIGGNDSSIASAVSVNLAAGQQATFIKFAGVASSDAFLDPRAVAKEAALCGKQTGYPSSLGSHIQEWAALFPSSSVDDFTIPGNGSLPQDPYVIEAAIIAVVNPFNLLQNTVSLNATQAIKNTAINEHGISVGGLGSDSYAGQVFWDADIWMHPGLVASFPFAASGITNYRKKLYPQAIANAQTSYQSSQNDTTFSSSAAVYPWTSGRYGNCTGTGPCWDYQYHLNGDIILAMTSQWLATGNESFLRDDLFPIANSVATLYSELLVRNGSFWSLKNMTDPDEYANLVDNGGYTMALIAETLEATNQLRARFNQTQNSTWTDQARSVLIGRDENAEVTLEYTGPIAQNGSITVKQADVVLTTYPLSCFNDNYTTDDAFNDLEYYANKQSADGPAMTWAIFSIVANEVSPSGCAAYTYQQYSYSPYIRAPWFQFSEQLIDDPSVNGGTHPAFPFLTGHGGAHQVLPYGYLGLRYVNNGYLNVDPAPPPQLPNIRYRTIYWQGWPIIARSNSTHTVISRQVEWNPSSGTTPNATFINTAIPVLVGSSADPDSQQLFDLPPNGTLTVPNRQYYKRRTVTNNAAQCRAIPFHTSDYIPGQFPISAVDGASSTRWQPMYANRSASITVSLPLNLRVVGIELDWGAEVPYNYSVVFHNESSASGPLEGDEDAIIVTSEGRIPISRPYNASEELVIRRVIGNTTTVYFNGSSLPSSTSSSSYEEINGPFPSSRFATLTIWGNQSNGSYKVSNMTGDGATVAEWAIVVADLPGADVHSPSTAILSKEKKTRSKSSSFLNKFGGFQGMANKAKREAPLV